MPVIFPCLALSALLMMPIQPMAIEVPPGPIIFISEEEPTPEVILTDEEIELLAKLTMAEAEGECELGKRLVIDTVFNRMDHEEFPDTIEGVIFQKNQFTPVASGRMDQCEVDEDICRLIREEAMSRTNYDVIFFSRAYSDYGERLFKVGNHCFSSYD